MGGDWRGQRDVQCGAIEGELLRLAGSNVGICVSEEGEGKE